MLKELSPELEDKIDLLRKVGYELQMSKKYLKAIEKFKEAYELMPEPRDQWQYAPLLTSAIAGNYFLHKDYKNSLDYFRELMTFPGSIGEASNHFHIGKCRFELGQLEKARYELLRAYLLDGAFLFEGEDRKYYELVKPLLGGKVKMELPKNKDYIFD